MGLDAYLSLTTNFFDRSRGRWFRLREGWAYESPWKERGGFDEGGGGMHLWRMANWFEVEWIKTLVKYRGLFRMRLPDIPEEPS